MQTQDPTSAPLDAPAGRRPDFLGLGGMRCGSTTLWEMLRVQPDVFLPEQKELHYFDNKDGLWDQGVGAYLDFFAGAEAGQVCGEITPEYLSVDYCTERMRELVPEAKLLVVLRDPVSRAWSHYRMSVGWGAETLPFDKAVRMEDQRLDKAGRGPAGIEANVAFSYLERGRYVEHLQRLEQAFSREQLLVLMLPEFRSDRPGVMRRVREHLGLPGEPPGGELERPPETTNALGPMCKNLKLNGLIHRLYPAARSGDTVLHKAARKALDATKRINTVHQEPQPSEAAKAWLRDYYAPFDAELEQWLGRPVPWRGK
ncbi:MAG: sulfotransferase domain-containing protein [Planctomycetota bacterium]